MAITFEATHAAVIKARAGGAPTGAAAMAAGAGPLGSICSTYQIIKPILKAIEGVPFFPKDWKDAIDAFFKVMDKICPGPMPAAAASFNDVDTAVKTALTAHWAGAPAAGGNLPNIGKDFCGAYKAIKPILDFASLFVPAAWKAGIIAFEAVADALCPA
jgi:hypothetical protein